MEPLAQTIAAGLGALLAFAAFIYVLCIVLTWAERVIMAWRRPDADATYAWKKVDELRAELAKSQQALAVYAEDCVKLQAERDQARADLCAAQMEAESLPAQSAFDQVVAERDAVRAELAKVTAERDEAQAKLRLHAGDTLSLQSEIDNLTERLREEESRANSCVATMDEALAALAKERGGDGELRTALIEVRRLVDNKSLDEPQCLRDRITLGDTKEAHEDLDEILDVIDSVLLSGGNGGGE